MARYLPVIGVLVAGVVLAAWVVMDTARDTPRIQRHRGRRSYAPTQFLGPTVLPNASLSGRYGTVGGQPRLFANLATRAGPYLVSVRQLYAEDRVRNLTDLLPPMPLAAAPLGRCHVVLQVNRLHPHSPEPQLDVDSIRAVTAQGAVLLRVQGPPDIEGRVPVAGAHAFRFSIAPVPPRETLLRELTGIAVETRDGISKRYPFRIANVPLPTHPRLFGEVVPVRLKHGPSQTQSTSVVLVGSTVEAASLDQWDASTERLPYLRLVLPIGETADLSAALAPDIPSVRLTAREFPDGNIAVSGTVGHRAWRVTVWDREPFVLTERNSADRRAIQVTLTRSNEPVFLPMAQSLFPPTPGEPAGSVALFVRVNERPLGPAMLPFSLQRWEEGGWSAPRGSSAPVKGSGLAVIGSLASGRYRLTLHPERISPMGAVKPVTLAEYLFARYHVQTGRWLNQTQVVDVGAGRRTYARPLVLQAEARATATHGN